MQRPGFLFLIAAMIGTLVLQSAAADSDSSIASAISSQAGHSGQLVTVIDRQDIELSGLKNVGELVLQRSVYNSFGIHRPLAIGAGRAAVFINGRRISDSVFDLDTLSLSAVQRIEVLRGSASALHGGHAAGGAINIVLTRGYEGLDVQASTSPTTRAGGDSEHASFLWGGSIGAGHITLGADFFQREEIRDKDRSYSSASWMPGGTFADTAGVSLGGNTLFIPLTDPIAMHESTLARPLGNCEGSSYTGELGEPQGIPGTGCGFAYADISWHLAPLEQYQREGLFLNLHYPLTQDVDLYFDVRGARADAKERYAPSVGTFPFRPSQSLAQRLLGDPQIDTAPDEVAVAHRFIGHGNREWDTDFEEYDLTLGLQGELGEGMGYELHARYYRHDADTRGDTFVSESLARKAIQEGRYDIENPRSASPTHQSAIAETALTLDREETTDHKTVRIAFDGSAFELAGGPSAWAVGVAYADEKRRNRYAYHDAKGASYEATDVLGSGGDSASRDRQRKSVFGELFLPLHKQWDLVLAAWHDDYDDVGSELSHQVRGQYRLNPAFSVRASWSQGAAPPGLNAQHGEAALGYPYVCDTLTFTGNLEDCHEFQVEQLSGGNPDLEADESESYSLGAEFDLGFLSLSADWFEIEVDDTPAQLAAQSIIDLEGSGQLPAGIVVVRDGGRITQIQSTWTNNGETEIAGVDIHASTGWHHGWASLVLELNWLHITRERTRVGGETQPGDQPHNRVHASFRASRGNLTANWTMHAISGYSNLRKTENYDSWMGHDLIVQWSSAFGHNPLELQAGLLNITNHGPSRDSTLPGLEGTQVTVDSALGRTLYLNARLSL